MLYTWDMGTPLSTSPQYTVTTTLRRNNTQISKLKFPYIIKRKLQKQYLNPPRPNFTPILTHCCMSHGHCTKGQENGVCFIHAHMP